MTVNPYYTIQCNSAVRHRRTGIPLMSGGDPLVFTAHPADEIGKALLGHVAFQAEAVPVICGCSSKEICVCRPSEGGTVLQYADQVHM